MSRKELTVEDYLDMAFHELPPSLQQTFKNVDSGLWASMDGVQEIVEAWLEADKRVLRHDDIFGEGEALATAPAPASVPTGGAVDWDDEHGGDYDDDSGYSELIDELSGRIKGLERQLAAAQAERDAYKAALEPFAELYSDWLVNPREIEFFDYLNRYRVSDELLAIVMNASVVIQEALQATEGE